MREITAYMLAEKDTIDQVGVFINSDLASVDIEYDENGMLKGGTVEIIVRFVEDTDD